MNKRQREEMIDLLHRWGQWKRGGGMDQLAGREFEKGQPRAPGTHSDPTASMIHAILMSGFGVFGMLDNRIKELRHPGPQIIQVHYWIGLNFEDIAYHLSWSYTELSDFHASLLRGLMAETVSYCERCRLDQEAEAVERALTGFRPEEIKRNHEPGYVRRLLNQAGLTQRVFAARANLSEKTVNQYFTGKVKMPYPVQFMLEFFASTSQTP